MLCQAEKPSYQEVKTMSKKRQRQFVDNIFTPREDLFIQEKREPINYQFTDDINKIDSILDKRDRESIVIEI